MAFARNEHRVAVGGGLERAGNRKPPVGLDLERAGVIARDDLSDDRLGVLRARVIGRNNC
jgi:hypothetical protein